MAGNDTRSDTNQSFFVFVKDNNTGVIRRIAIPGDVQIGLKGSPAELQLFGRLSVSSKTYTINKVNKGVIGITNDDTVVALRLHVTPDSGRITVTLPATPREGQLHFIKDLTGTADTVPIDIFPPSGVTIDNQSMKSLTDEYGSLALIWLHGQWRMLVAGLGASGGGGIPASLSYVTINPESALSHERHLTGSTNIRMTDQGANANVSFDLSQILGGSAGTYAYATVTADAFGRITGISAGSAPPTAAGYLTAGSEPSLPNRRQMSGGLGTTVSDGGAGATFSFSVDPLVIPFLTGANVFKSPNTFSNGLTGSLTQLPGGAGAYIIGIGGVLITTTSSGQIVISGSSGGSSTNVVGTGGTSASYAAGVFTVSSSIYADKFAHYLQLSSSAQNTNARNLVAGQGIAFKDTGPGGNLTVTATADPNAPHVMTFTTGSVPGARRLEGTNGITITDQGAGNRVLIGFTPLTSQSANVYHGYCTGSLLFNATSWTDFASVPGNFTDVYQVGINRSGSTFTVAQDGFYKWHSFFNQIGFNTYEGWRLSGSNGTILQRTTYADNVTGNDQPSSLLEGIIQLTSGTSFKLQYVTKTGTPGTWTATDPIDGENMRTGEISVFRVADPLTLNYVPSVDPFGWTLAYFVDFTQQASGTFGGNGTRSYNSVTWNIENYGNGTRIGIDPTAGLTFVNSVANVDYGNAATRNAPLLSLKVQDVLPKFSYPNMPFRVWALLGINSAVRANEGQFLGVERWGTTSQTICEKKVFTTAFGYQAQGSLNNANIYTQTVDTSNTTHDVVMLLWLNDRQVEHWTGTSVSGSFPDPATMTLRGTTLLSNATFFQSPLSGSLDFAFTLGSVTNNTVGTLTTSVKKFKLEYLQTTAGQTVGVSPTTYWRQLTSSLSALTASSNWTQLLTVPVFVTSSGAPVLVQYAVCSERNTSGSNFARIRWDGVEQDQCIVSTANATGGSQTMASTFVVMSASTGFHTLNLDFRTDANNASIVLPTEHANLFAQELPFGTTLQILSGGNSGADLSASYVLVGSTGSLPNSRTIVAGGGITVTDNGPGNTLVIGATGGGGSGNVDPNAPIVVTFQTGSVQSGRTLTGGAGINITDFGSGSNVLVSDVGHHWAAGVGKIKSTGSVAIDSLNKFADQVGTDVFFYVSGSSGLLPGDPSRKVSVLNDTFVSGVLQVVDRTAFDGTGATARSKGVDNYHWVSGTVNLQGANARKSVFGGDVVVTGSITALAGPGFTGSLTQTSTGLSYLVGVGGVAVTSNSLGQVLISGSVNTGGGSGGTTVNNIVSGTAAQGQAAYYGFTSASLFWMSASAAFVDISTALFNGSLTDSINSNILRSGSTWTFLNGGLYAFHAGFNASGSNAFITLRWRGSNSGSISRTTYRTDAADQSPVLLDGVFSASIGESWVLEYTTSGSVFPWTGSNPLPGGGNMVTGEVSFFMLPNNVTTPAATLNVLTTSLGTTVTLTSPTYTTLCSVTSSFTDVEVWAKISGIGAGPNVVWTKVQVDNLDVPNLGTFTETFTSGSGFGGELHGRVVGLASGTHTFSLLARHGGGAGPTITVPSSLAPHEGASIMVQNLTASNTGIGPAPKAPIYTMYMLAGTVTTNTAHAGSKQSLGMAFFDPSTIQGFGGTSRKYFYRAVIDCLALDTNLSSAVDLYDVNGIVGYPPGIITGSFMSSSNSTAVQLQVDLTSRMQTISGSGLFEARLWRTVSGSLSSIANCRNARIDVEIT